MLEQVRQSLFERIQILGAEFRLWYAAVILERANRSNDHNGARLQSGHAALDIEELLRAEISAEAGLGNRIVRQTQRDFGSGHGVASMRNIGKRAAMHERRRMLQRLHKVRLERILEQRGHRARSVQIACGDRLFIIGIANHQTGKARLQIGDIAGQTQHGHDLRRNGDIISVLARHAVDAAAETIGNEAELAVVHIHAPAPCDASRVDIELIALINMVVQHSREQVVGRADGMEVTGKMQVDILHGDDLRIAAARCAALYAEHRTKGGFAQCDKHVLSEPLHGIRKTDGRRRFAFARRGRIDGGDEHQLALALLGFLQDVVIHLRLVIAVLLQIFGVDAGRFGDLGDVQHGGFLCNFDVRLVAHDPFLSSPGAGFGDRSGPPHRRAFS